jgi:hypothetical protein
MKTLIIALAGLFAGAVLGTVATGGRSTELGMTMGLVIGAQGGVCAAVESARRTGALDDATAVRVLAEAVRRLRAVARLETATGDWPESLEDCPVASARLADLGIAR